MWRRNLRAFGAKTALVTARIGSELEIGLPASKCKQSSMADSRDTTIGNYQPSEGPRGGFKDLDIQSGCMLSNWQIMSVFH